MLNNIAEGWNGKDPIFSILIEKYQPVSIIEIGSWKGQSAITMAQFCKLLALDTTIYCVDTWLGALEMMDSCDKERNLHKINGYPTVFKTFIENIEHHEVDDMITVIAQTSHIASKYFKNKNIDADMVYIDGSHEYEDVYQDIEDYFPITKKVIFGDDYNNEEFPGVKNAVENFCFDNSLDFYVSDSGFWVIELE